jgi:hypothetical protein
VGSTIAIQFPSGAGDYSVDVIVSGPAVGPTQPHTQYVMEALFTEVKAASA